MCEEGISCNFGNLLLFIELLGFTIHVHVLELLGSIIHVHVHVHTRVCVCVCVCARVHVRVHE